MSRRPRSTGFVVEGVDGVGKTTFGERFAEVIGAQHLDAPYREILGSKSPVGDIGLEGRYVFYRSANAVTSWLLENLIEGPVVLDKYQMSTIAFARALGQKATWQEKLWQPEATIYLAASSVVRDSRLDHRTEKPRHRFEASQLLDRAAVEYVGVIREREFAGDRILAVDTTELAADEVLKAVLDRL